MNELPANPNVVPRRYSPFFFRFFEILPGAVVWSVLITPFFLARSHPAAVATFVLIFDLYWLIKAVSYGIILLYGYRNLSATLACDWQAQLNDLEARDSDLDWRKVHHAIILTAYKEDRQTLELSIQSAVKAHYAKERMTLIIACEERDSATSIPIAESLINQYGSYFLNAFYTVHPDDIVGEVKAKGANATWAAKQLVAKMEKAHIPLQNVIVSCADADSRFHHQYFARLTYLYVTTPDRLRVSFQPVAMYFNNIWDAPMLSRVLAFGTTFWQMIESIRTYRLITFATHATSLYTLRDMDYWCTSIVNEDSRQYFRGFFHYNGKFRVVPIFLPIYMDAVHVGALGKSLRNLYLQQQRWAYGVEHFPYIVLESFRRHKIPLLDRLTLVWRAFEGAFTWSTSSFFITIVGWIPFMFNTSFKNTLIAHNFQVYTRDILTLTWIGLFISIYLTLKLLPPLPVHKRQSSRLLMLIQWICVPIAAIFFGSLPAIDAQTRLMLGKYIGFRVTEKTAHAVQAATR